MVTNNQNLGYLRCNSHEIIAIFTFELHRLGNQLLSIRKVTAQSIFNEGGRIHTSRLSKKAKEANTFFSAYKSDGNGKFTQS